MACENCGYKHDPQTCTLEFEPVCEFCGRVRKVCVGPRACSERIAAAKEIQRAQTLPASPSERPNPNRGTKLDGDPTAGLMAPARMKS